MFFLAKATPLRAISDQQPRPATLQANAKCFQYYAFGSYEDIGMFFLPLCVCALSRVWPFVIPWTADCQAPHLRNFPSKNTGKGCHFLLQGFFPTPGIEPLSLVPPALAGRFFTPVLFSIGRGGLSLQSVSTVAKVEELFSKQCGASTLGEDFSVSGNYSQFLRNQKCTSQWFYKLCV